MANSVRWKRRQDEQPTGDGSHWTMTDKSDFSEFSPAVQDIGWRQPRSLVNSCHLRWPSELF